MALVIVHAPGLSTSNSYVSRAEADAYFEARPNSDAWTSAADPEQALIAATARLDLEQFVGYKFLTEARLKWPRFETYDDDGNPYDSATIPQRVKDATCELALHMLNSGTTDSQAATGLEQFESISLGNITLTPNQSAPKEGDLPTIVLRILRGLIQSSRGNVRLERA